MPSGLTAVLIAPASLFVAMFAPLLDRSEVIGREQAGGLVVGLVGVALLVGIETVDTLDEFLGALMILGASVCYALSSFVVKNGYRDTPSIAVSWISVTAGALLADPGRARGPARPRARCARGDLGRGPRHRRHRAGLHRLLPADLRGRARGAPRW